ncbi:MAG: transcription antitermination factor NusB [Tunicatimonas sp.]
MLNRRLLRIRAMQHLYAYQRCRQANYELAFEFIRESFAPDLNSMEVQDREALAQQRTQADELLTARLEGQTPAADASRRDVGRRIEQVVDQALRNYHEQCRKDQRFLRQQMVARTEKIGDYYRRFLVLPDALLQEAGRDAQKRSANPRASNASGDTQSLTNLINNRLLAAVRNSDALQETVRQQQLSWEGHRTEVRHLLKVVRSDPDYQTYQALAEPSREEDIAIVRHIVNSLALNHASIINIFEEDGVNWEEDKKVIKNLTNRTFKSLKKEDEGIEVASLTPNWEDDRAFFEELYEQTLRHDEEYEQLISEKSKNWAADRIASVDNVIMKMAIAEMIHFSSIPVKVTINEYVDISKLYSTQKSRQFINGILDVVSQELQKQGLIRKSGRGLMDN